jgi:hypothetical protein
MTGEDDDTSIPEKPEDAVERLRKAQEAFAQGVKEREEAAERDEHGQLPPDALFEIKRDGQERAQTRPLLIGQKELTSGKIDGVAGLSTPVHSERCPLL